MGTIEVICGPMFSGKTEELIRLVRRAMHARKKVQVFKSSLDIRCETEVIRTHDDITEDDAPLIGHLHVVAVKLAQQLGLSEGYRIVVNCKEGAGQSVFHLHFHLLGGRPFRWPPG